MVDITHKNTTLRKAIATAVVSVSRRQTIEAVRQRQVPKGDIFEFARASAFFAIKKTSDVIPDCHPLPVEYAAVDYRIEGLAIHINVEVHTIYKTGVEVEAMHGASIAALVIYDMLKPIDGGVTIQNIALKEKQGGKSDKRAGYLPVTSVIVCSDRVYQGAAQDSSGEVITAVLGEYGIDRVTFSVVPDQVDEIREVIAESKIQGAELIILTGGTGLSERDVTPEAVAPLLDKPVPGIMEAARAYGRQRTGTAMLSRGIAGFSESTLIITLPGSVNGVRESLKAIFPDVLHVFSVRKNEPH